MTRSRNPNESKNIKENQSPSALQKFLFRCAGANEYILAMDECKTDRDKFASIGSLVLFISLIASLSSGYAFFIIFNDLVLSSTFGLLWGFWGIRSLDRQFLINIKKRHKKHWTGQVGELAKQTVGLLPRMGLAVVVALVVSKPLEVKIFEDKIKAELATIRQRDEDSLKKKRLNESPELANLNNQKEESQKELFTLSEQRKIAYKDFVDEAEGRSGTGRIGKGIVASEKQEEVQRLDQKISQLETTIRNINNNLEETRNRVVVETKSLRNKLDSFDGFIAQLKTLEELSKKDDVIRSINIFIMLIFILLEISPILLKTFSQFSPYDAILEKLEKESINSNLIDIEVSKQLKNDSELVRKETELLKHERMIKIESKTNETEKHVVHEKTLRDQARKVIQDQFTQILHEAINDPNGKLTEARSRVIEQIAEQIERELLKYTEQIAVTGKDMYDLLKKIRDEEIEHALRSKVHQAKIQSNVEEISQEVKSFDKRFSSNGFRE